MCRSYQKVLLKKYPILFLVIINVFENTLTSSTEEKNATQKVSFIIDKNIKDSWPKQDLLSFETASRTKESSQRNFLKTLENSMITPTEANVSAIFYPITPKKIQMDHRQPARIDEIQSQNEGIVKMKVFSAEKGNIEGTTRKKDSNFENLDRLRTVITSSNNRFAIGTNPPYQDINQKLVKNIDANSFIRKRTNNDVKLDVNKNSQSQTRSNHITSGQTKNLVDIENELETIKRPELLQDTFLTCGTNYSLDLTFNNVETWELECTLVLSRRVQIRVSFEGLKENKFVLEFSASKDHYRSNRDEDNMTPVCIPCRQCQSVCIHFANSYIRQPKYVSLHPYLILGDDEKKRFELGSLDLILDSKHEYGYKQSHSSHDTKHPDSSDVQDFTQAVQSVKHDHQPNTHSWNSNGYHGNMENSGYHGNHAHSYHSNVNNDHGHHGNKAHYHPDYHGNYHDSLHSNIVNQNPEYYDASSYDNSGYSHPGESFDRSSIKAENGGWNPISNYYPH